MFSAFRRSQLLPNREKLKTFIRSYAIRLGNRADSPWIFYDKSIQEKYQIKDRISPTVIETFQKSMIITLDVGHMLYYRFDWSILSLLGNSSRTRPYFTKTSRRASCPSRWRK